MTSKLTTPPVYAVRGPSRRTVIKGGAAALAASTIFKPAILRAADNVIRIGHVSPRTGPMAGFAEADDYIFGVINDSLKNGLQIGGKPTRSRSSARTARRMNRTPRKSPRSWCSATRSTSSQQRADQSTAIRSPMSPS